MRLDSGEDLRGEGEGGGGGGGGREAHPPPNQVFEKITRTNVPIWGNTVQDNYMLTYTLHSINIQIMYNH